MLYFYLVLVGLLFGVVSSAYGNEFELKRSRIYSKNVMIKM